MPADPDPVELTRRLIAIDSVNPALVPGGAGEAAIAEFTAAWLTGHASTAACSSTGRAASRSSPSRAAPAAAAA